MEGCIHCQRNVLIEDGGTLIIATDQQKNAQAYSDILSKYRIQNQVKNAYIHIEYDLIVQVQAVTALLDDHIEEKDKERMRGNIVVEKDLPDFVHFPLYPYKELEYRIRYPQYVNIIQNKRFTSHMQPIFCTKEGSVYGYEFLLRPSDDAYPFFPGELFSFSQRSGMQSMLDSHARINAIRTGSERLKDEKIFINFLPSSIYDPAHCLKSTFEAANTYNVNPERLVFEVVETEKIVDVAHLKNIFYHYQNAGVKVALDDIGTGYATIDMLKQLNPDYAKIDRSLIQDCHQHPDKIARIQAISEVAKAQGTLLLGEGIETKEEYETVKSLVDYTQGYYFAKPQAEPFAG
ncbi:EAL domain-containing protein [Salisediminibacterium selenitireducens]|uniref:Diguanylate phosphodiesterase n=1 Tax=Bacillus selenitireducens (strain ATCC 700615 / DSM 15326 / MLS10) TaxID=439292 RepID=D6XT73_BACIE|nr:EAL domain-containing protein [Salisediminibacterium selenitireducens]ADH99009.1 diguanylate phosphodiesterase [[Bacillus] selenitireducens MLS10]